jgi:putative sterol carrier protein
MPAAFRPEKAQGVQAVFQYVIGGQGGGEWFCEVTDGACRVAAGRHSAPSCTLAMEAADFLAMMNGRLPPMQAFTSGRLKISGDVLKSQLIEKLFQRRTP